MRILLVNQPLRNRGDEAAHRAFVRSLIDRLPADTTFEVLFVDQKDEDIEAFRVENNSVAYTNIKSVKYYWSFRKRLLEKLRSVFLLKLAWRIHPTTAAVLRTVRKADVVVCCPGGTCMGWQQNWEHLFFLYAAKLLGKPLVYWGRSIGPFPQDNDSQTRFFNLSKEILHYCSFVSLRDSQSLSLAESLGIKAIPTTDSAFLFKPEVVIPEKVSATLNSPYMVFVPNILTCMKGFMGKISEEDSERFFGTILNHILDSCDYDVVMLPQTFNQGEWNDILFFRKLAESCGNKRVKVLPDTLSSDIQQAIISKADYLVGARYHSIVFAINNSVPFVAFSYEHKISGLLELLKTDHKGIDLLNAFDSRQNETRAIKQFDQHFGSLKESRSNYPEASKIATGAFNRLVDFLSILFITEKL